MAEASSVDLALNGFRKRGRPFVLTGATIVYVLGAVLVGLAVFALIWPKLAELVSWYAQMLRAARAGGEPSLPRLELLLNLAPYYGLYLVFALVWYAAYEAACLRWMTRGETGGVFGISLGADTWRVLGVYLVWLALGLACCILIGAFYGALIAVNSNAPALRLPMMLIGALAPLGFAALLVWLATRLSAAAAASVARRRFAFFGAWGLSRGRFWDMLGAFVIVFAVYLGVAFILSIAIRWPMSHVALSVGRDMAAQLDAEAIMQRVGDLFATPWIVGLLCAYALASIIAASLFRVAWFGVNAAVAAGGEAAAAPSQPAPAQTPPSAPAAPPVTEPPPSITPPPPAGDPPPSA